MADVLKGGKLTIKMLQVLQGRISITRNVSVQMGCQEFWGGRFLCGFWFIFGKFR